jgi:hypothetical protein
MSKIYIMGYEGSVQVGDHEVIIRIPLPSEMDAIIVKEGLPTHLVERERS